MHLPRETVKCITGVLIPTIPPPREAGQCITGNSIPMILFPREAENASEQLGFNGNNIGLLFMISNNPRTAKGAASM